MSPAQITASVWSNNDPLTPLQCSCSCQGESVSVIKHTDPVPDPRAVNQDKKNMLFSVSTPSTSLSCTRLEWLCWNSKRDYQS